MAITLPMPIRVAAGVVGTAVDRITHLPQELPALGIQLAGQAFRAGLRIRQELAELATRGDELLAGITGPQERPAWATFDEELPADPTPEPAPAHTAASHTATSHTATTRTGTTEPLAAEPPDPSRPSAAGDHQPRAARSRPHPAPATGNRRAAQHDNGSPQETVAELRARIQHLPVDEVRTLLAAEEAGPARAARITLLTNRLTTLEHAAQ